MPLLALLKSGDHVVYFAELYGPTRALIGRLLRRYGVTSTLLSIDDLDGARADAGRDTDPTGGVRVADQPGAQGCRHRAMTSLARRHGALTLLDNTLAGLHNHGEFDVDLYAHSLTKYASGHGDVMGGAVIGRADLIASLRDDVSILGPTLDPHAASCCCAA